MQKVNGVHFEGDIAVVEFEDEFLCRARELPRKLYEKIKDRPMALFTCSRPTYDDEEWEDEGGDNV